MEAASRSFTETAGLGLGRLAWKCCATCLLTKPTIAGRWPTQARCWLEWGCSRRGFLLQRLQVTLSAAKLGARVGAVHEKARRGGICLCNHRRQDHGTW